MADDDERATPDTADDIEIAERRRVFPQGSKVLGEFAVLVASDRHSARIVSTLLGHDHVQHVAGNVTKAQHGVSIDVTKYNACRVRIADTV